VSSSALLKYEYSLGSLDSMRISTPSEPSLQNINKLLLRSAPLNVQPQPLQKIRTRTNNIPGASRSRPQYLANLQAFNASAAAGNYALAFLENKTC